MNRLLLLASIVAVVAAHGAHDHDHSHDHGHDHGHDHSHDTYTEPVKPEDVRAIVKLEEPGGGKVHGNVTFVRQPDGKVRVSGVIVGMPPGHYGFHIYEKGDITGGCGNNGGHFNPHNKEHGHPEEENRHAGDLGNVQFDENGVSNVDFTDGVIQLWGPHSIVGRAIVLHSMADDYGKGGHPDSKKTGNAGSHVACGVIGYW
ncbi:unnamed protein product, partial [Iphiclides podalirius]